MRALGLALGLALVLAAACGGGPLDNVEVASAALSRVAWNGATVVVGFTETTAILTLVDTSGKAHDLNVDVSGPVVGFLMDISADGSKGDPTNCFFQSSANLTLPAGKTLTGSDVAGGYFGTKEAAHLGVGGESNDLQNGAGVKLTGGAVNLGFGVLVGFEWLNISVQQ